MKPQEISNTGAKRLIIAFKMNQIGVAKGILGMVLQNVKAGPRLSLPKSAR